MPAQAGRDMSLRAAACYALSRRLMAVPQARTIDYAAYDGWRESHLARSWAEFSDAHVAGKDVLDFGCGDGQLAALLRTKSPRRIVGIDLNAAAIGRARAARPGIEFMIGSSDRIPVPDASFDTIVAFDCLEHIMSPRRIFEEWHRVLRPGGRVLAEWYPYKGPWGPHMEALIPIPWAHVLFGQEAMFRAAERIYDEPSFVPRHWDLDESGRKRPNKWRAWSSFRQQGYINELDIGTFNTLAAACGLVVDRLDLRSFGGSLARRRTGRALMRLPLVGEYFVSYTLVELRRAA
jgi:SAM-dependent methyltransferase